MPNLGAPELIVILVIVIVIFGVGRLGEVGSALGKGIREFRRESSGADEDAKKEERKPTDSTTKP